MTFYISNLNPIRFTGGAGNKFDRLFMEELINKYQAKSCYFQKWNLGDSTRIQVLSDFEFTFKIFEVDGGEVADLDVIEIESDIVGQTFTVYEVQLDFDTEGDFYAVIEYNGNTLTSEAWTVGEFDGTILFTYKNSENNFSVLFDGDLEFKLRVEGVVADFEPKSEDVIYNDQTMNSRVLNSVPWRSFTMYAGNEAGIPDWMADKVNRIMSCDTVFVDSQTFDGYISKVDGAEWEVVRHEENAMLGISTEIMEVENDLLERLKRGEEDINIKIVQKVDNYFDVDSLISVTETFAKYKLLEKICIEKEVGQPGFLLNVGTTDGGSEIGTFEISDDATTCVINWLFLGSVNVYLTGFAQTLPFVSVIYKNLIESPIGLGGGGGAEGGIPVGAQIIYNPVAGRAVSDDFDLSTGLGREDTDWFGYSICNGQNGTEQMGEFFPFGFKNGTNANNDTGGESEVTLTISQLPAHSHGYENAVGNSYKRGNVGSRFFENGAGVTKQTDTAGTGQGHNNMPPYKVKIWVQKIF